MLFERGQAAKPRRLLVPAAKRCRGDGKRAASDFREMDFATEQREANGHIARDLSFPLEDLYPDGQPAGQVGQEVYGAGAAFIFASRALHPVEGAPFRLYCDLLLRAVERIGDRALSIQLDGGETRTANLRLVRLPRRTLPDSKLVGADGEPIDADAIHPDRIDYRVPANGRMILTWE